MDEDAPQFFWGHKSRDEARQTSHAGTSAKPLQAIRFGELYAGLDVEDSDEQDFPSKVERSKTKSFSIAAVTGSSKESIPPLCIVHGHKFTPDGSVYTHLPDVL
jgi:hypothetical protein